MTAPLPKTRTVLVVSEKGSRFSLPSAARTPLTVTGTSSATGCCLTAESADNVVADGGRCAVSGLAVRISLSLAVGGMGCTLATENFLGRPVPDRVPLEHLYVLPPGRGSTIVRAYYGGNTCPDGQALHLRQGQASGARCKFQRNLFSFAVTPKNFDSEMLAALARPVGIRQSRRSQAFPQIPDHARSRSQFPSIWQVSRRGHDVRSGKRTRYRIPHIALRLRPRLPPFPRQPPGW